MKKYDVTLRGHYEKTISVYADSPEEAKKKTEIVLFDTDLIDFTDDDFVCGEADITESLTDGCEDNEDEDACLEYEDWNDESEIVCYHGFQSFKSGELTPEQAHEVGVKLAEKMLGDRFQVIVATHLNTDCLHNHFVVNSVSFADGKHYHDNKASSSYLYSSTD